MVKFQGLQFEIRNAEQRYVLGQITSLFLFGVLCGSLLGWCLWG